MKTRNLLVLAIAAVLFSACIPSVNPFYAEKDVVFDARLLGEWKAVEEEDTWKFERGEENAYKLTVTEREGKQGEFHARLFRLKNEYFLDIIPVECNYATNQADLVAFSMFPGHLLVRVPQLGPELKLAFFDFEWLEKHLKKNPKALAHHMNERGILLTAETAALKKFVLKHLREGELFSKPGVLKRMGASESAPASP